MLIIVLLIVRNHNAMDLRTGYKVNSYFINVSYFPNIYNFLSAAVVVISLLLLPISL